jgi:transcriptional regulator with XRE-family HTH domain
MLVELDLDRGFAAWRAALLRERREAAGLTQVELAFLLDVSERTVQRAESGTAPADDVLTSWLRICSIEASHAPMETQRSPVGATRRRHRPDDREGARATR